MQLDSFWQFAAKIKEEKQKQIEYYRSHQALLYITQKFENDDKRNKELVLTEDELIFFDLLPTNRKILNQAGLINPKYLAN